MIIVICLDGMNDAEFSSMAQDAARYPHTARFAAGARFTGGVRSVFVSNTYPVHTSIITGGLPRDHGIISNYIMGSNSGEWVQDSALIKMPTLFDECARWGLRVASVCWPVTCGMDIRWHIPEVHIKKGQNQVWQQLRRGSPLWQLGIIARHITKLAGINHPERATLLLDYILASAAADAVKRKKPALTLVHLMSFDLVSHFHGKGSEQLEAARRGLDDALGRITDAAPSGAGLIVFSDHGHIVIKETIDLHDLFGGELVEQCGGCAFFRSVVEPAGGWQAQAWFNRVLTDEEMDISGYAPYAAMGVAAKPGYAFGARAHKSNHGYPLDCDDYRVFYATHGLGVDAMGAPPHGDIRDVGWLIRQSLGIL